MNRYMQSSQNNFKLLGLTLLLVFAFAFVAVACEPGGFPIIENQRNHEVNIYTILVREDGTLGESINYGVVPAQSTKELASITFVRREWVYRIQAMDPAGNVVFSRDYNWYDLEKISWKIAIPP